MAGHRHQGKRFKKKPGEISVRLTKDDVEFLKRNTRYSEKEIKEWFREPVKVEDYKFKYPI